MCKWCRNGEYFIENVNNNEGFAYNSIPKLAIQLKEKHYSDFVSHKCLLVNQNVFAIYLIFSSNFAAYTSIQENGLSYLRYGKLYSIIRNIKRIMIH